MVSTIKIRNCHTLAYEEYGDHRGKPVFFFHGTPGSRIFRPPDEITKRLSVNLIAVDRPGYGESTFQPNRRILDWPEDITQLANTLGIGKFAIAGHSGGGPYVAACAYSLPDRVTAATIVSGAGPINVPKITQGMSNTNSFGIRVGRFTPWPLWRILIWVFYHRRSENPESDIDRNKRHRPLPDERLLQSPIVRETCIQSEIEAFRQGLRGLAWDSLLLTRPWGFHLEDIHLPVFVWHGSDDNQATIPMAHHFANKIPGCKLTVCDNEAHLLLFSHWENILMQLSKE